MSEITKVWNFEAEMGGLHIIVVFLVIIYTEVTKMSEDYRERNTA